MGEMYIIGAEVVNVCFVLIIKTYKVTSNLLVTSKFSNNCSEVKAQYLPENKGILRRASVYTASQVCHRSRECSLHRRETLEQLRPLKPFIWVLVQKILRVMTPPQYLPLRCNGVEVKVLKMEHITPALKNKMDASASPYCFKCKTEIGNYIHSGPA